VWADVAKGIHQMVEECSSCLTISLSNKKTDSEIFQVPFPRNRFFTGGDKTLANLRKILRADDAVASTQVAVVTGLGGVGKTQTALEYAYCHRQDYRIIWWIDSETLAGLNLGFAGLARALGLPEADLADHDRILAAVHNCLERRSDWLLFLDNAEQPKVVKPYLPASITGHVLITSRNPLWRSLGEATPLTTWPRAQSIEFLVKRSGRMNQDDAGTLAEELGDLPLALEQAAAYIEATGQTFGGYLALYRRRFAELAQEFQPEHYPNTVLTTWRVSLAAIEQETLVAGDLLRLFAFLAPDDIPRALLTEHPEVLPQRLSEASVNGIAFDKAIGVLYRYSLVQITNETFAVHRLVQAVTRALLIDKVFWSLAAVELISEAFPPDPRNTSTWPICVRLHPHVESVLSSTEDLNASSKSLILLLCRVGEYLRCNGENRASRVYLERALRLHKTTLKSVDLDVIYLFKELGLVLRAQGDLDGAQTYFEQALRISEAVFGSDHLAAAWPLTCLGTLLRIKGELVRAQDCHERALRIRESALGSNHPDIAWSLNGLGVLRRLQKDYAGAQAYFERALRISEIALNPNHPDIARFLKELGVVSHAQGHLERAQLYFERSLTISEIAYGHKHFFTRELRKKIVRNQSKNKPKKPL
jgi:tetratricopeptide (TPR) repeat protein